MLAQNFKTATDLEIGDEAYRSLITVLGMLEREEMKHVHNPYSGAIDTAPRFTGLFNMDAWDIHTTCGTVACIGGSCELVGGFKFTADEMTVLDGLFYPSDVHSNWKSITVEQAATALRSFLTTGSPHWQAALSSTMGEKPCRCSNARCTFLRPLPHRLACSLWRLAGDLQSR